MINYNRIITDDEQKILENDLLDVVDWINQAIKGKINCCFKRAAQQFDELAKKENMDMVPAKPELKVKSLFEHPKYANRRSREQQLTK